VFRELRWSMERRTMSVMRQGSRESPAWYADRWRWFEIAFTTVVLLAYFAVRGMRPVDANASVSRSLDIIRLEQQIGLFHEVDWQQAFLAHDLLIQVANFVYAWGHYAALLPIAGWLLVKDLRRFRFLRNVMVMSALIGIVTYWVLPAAPPRLMGPYGYDFGFNDTVHSATSNAHYFQPGPFVNDFAALPSFHFGWIALASAAIWVSTKNRWLRTGAVGISAVMWWAVTVTGNHFFVDMIFGGVVVLVSWGVVAAMSRASASPRLRGIVAGAARPVAARLLWDRHSEVDRFR